MVYNPVHGGEELHAAVRGVHAVMIGLQIFHAPLTASMRRCRVISRYGIGYDNIDVDAATRGEIWVVRVPDYGWEDVSDHAVAMFLGCLDRRARAGRPGRARPLRRITLGMTDTHFSLPPEKESRRVVIHGLDTAAKGRDGPTRYISASGGLSSTAEDFLRFEQMLANGGTLFGKRLLSPRSVATMSSNQVGELYQLNGKQPGWGFGYSVAVVLDPAAAKSTRGQGAFGTTTWTDPAQEITAVLMVQQGSGRVAHDFEHAIRAAIVD